MDFQLSALPSAPGVTFSALPGPINALIRAQQLQRFLSLLHESSACVAVSLWQDSSLCKENALRVSYWRAPEVSICVLPLLGV